MTKPAPLSIAIRELTPKTLPMLQEHLARHFAESGRNDFHFLPFVPDDPLGPRGIDGEKSKLGIGEPHWERWFMAFDTETGKVCAHVNLKGYGLRTCAHRCVLGIGIEEHYRGLGLGRRLMATAIEFVRAIETIHWLDLMVFAHNTPARKLYASLGFEEIGCTQDKFRIGTVVIDDVSMTLNVAISA